MAKSCRTNFVDDILEIARWAPSGDNAQPWAFQKVGPEKLYVHIRHDPGNVYEYAQGQPTYLSAGALLECINIAAAHFGYSSAWQYQGDGTGTELIEVSFSQVSNPTQASLFNSIPTRSVDRRPYKLKSIEQPTLAALLVDKPSNLQIDWYPALWQRLRIAKLVQLSTKIRLTIPEAFLIHKQVVDWSNSKSKAGIPSQALGLDPFTLRLMRWSFGSWARNDIMNRLGAPFFASLEMDLLPGLFSSAYFAFRCEGFSDDVQARRVQVIKIGQYLQQFWLRATTFGLSIQPCLAVLAFAHYGAHNCNFTSNKKAHHAAARLADRVGNVLGSVDNLAFLGRIGWPRGPVTSRSLRLSLSELLK